MEFLLKLTGVKRVSENGLKNVSNPTTSKGNWEIRWNLKSLVNPFVANASFLYPLKTQKNRKVFWSFQGVEKGNKWVNWYTKYYLSAFTCEC